MSLGICWHLHPVVALPNILPFIVSGSSESCCKMCPTHANLHYHTVSKVCICFLGLYATLHHSLPFQPSLFSPFFSRPTFQTLIVFLYQLVSLFMSQQPYSYSTQKHCECLRNIRLLKILVSGFWMQSLWLFVLFHAHCTSIVFCGFM